MKHKFICLLIILSISITMVLSCNSTEDPIDNVMTEATIDDTGLQEETTLLIDSLLKEDFNNETFTIYGSNTLNHMDFVTVKQFHIGSETGEPVNDTLYQRDRFIEEKYNVKINNIITDGNPDPNVITNSVLSGDKEFDIFYGDSATIGSKLYFNNVLVDMYTVPHIKFDESYWQGSAQEALTIDGKNFFATGPITPRFFGAIYVMSFNKTIHNNYNLPNYYELAINYQWTIDIFMENCRNISTDLNGDGIMDENDLYGLGYELLTPEAMYIGCGYNIVTKEGEELTFSLDEPSAVDLIQKLKDFYWEEDVCFYYEKRDTDLMFIESKLLFNNPALLALDQFREMEDDYGILPMPLLNEKQDVYYSYGQPWANSFVYMPVTNTDLERTGAIVEAMAVYSEVYLKPVIYDNILLIKGTRDVESAQVIDLMMKNIKYDLAPMFNFGNIYKIFNESMLTENGNITSLYAANEESGKAAINELLNVVR